MIDVVFVVLPSTLLLDLAGPAEAFRLANQQLARRDRAPHWRLRYAGPRAQAMTSTGATLGALEVLPASLPDAACVVLMGQPSGEESALRTPLPAAWAQTRRWLARTVAPRLGDGIQLMTVCAGALLAADAGLLGHRRCTTHHEMLADLQRLAPTAQVLSDRLFVEDGPVLSSAGITAGIDLALHLIAREGGDALAAAVAQAMVVYGRRGLNDPQRSPMMAGRDHVHAAVHRVQDAVCGHPAHDWSAAALAEVAHVTPRHLARLFRLHVGGTPRAYVQAIRVAAARRALDGGEPLKRALAEAGFAGDRQWRRTRARQP